MQKPKKAGWIATAADAKGWPNGSAIEIALTGRSNAGKSTILNALLGRREARVSQKPGHTKLLHFYSAGDIRIVDMPGYGFARRAAEERDSWGPMIETYLAERANLAGLLLIVDVKRPWTKTESDLIDWLSDHGRSVVLVYNKIDKFNRRELDAVKREVTKAMDPRISAVRFVSGKTGAGIEDLRRTIFEKLCLP